MELLSSPYYKDHTVYNENMVGFYKNKKIIKLNKPQYIGFVIFEFSKLIMVDFHYNYSINKYGNNAKLLYSDIDSLIYHIKTKYIYEELCDENDKFDFHHIRNHIQILQDTLLYTLMTINPLYIMRTFQLILKKILILKYQLKGVYASPKLGS